MLPIKSNTAEQGCSPVSSNCVIWQGPDIACLNLCNGDTVSDVVYKVAEKLCTIQTELGLSSLDLSCLVSFATSVGPAPTNKTLLAVLDFIVKKICGLNIKVDAINPSGGGSTTEPNINLPVCLQYQDPATGQTITQLQHSVYTLRLANQFCTLTTTVSTHTTQIASLGTRVTALENASGFVLPKVTPNCILTPNVPTDMNLVLDELEAQYCNLRAVLGTNTALTSAAAQQCNALGAQPALSQTGTMSSLTGWNATVSNVAQSFQNLWITVCDMRAAIADLKTNTSTVDCTQFILNFNASANEARTQVTLFFQGLITIPSGFANCNQQGSKVTIKDSANNTFVGYVDLVAAASDSDGVTFTVSGANLNASLTYTVTVEGCLSKSGQSCTKTVSKNVVPPCPIITGVTATLS
jgi:hypothetical protein